MGVDTSVVAQSSLLTKFWLGLMQSDKLVTGPFKDFDFSLLDHPEFGEDSVREELIVPLLAALGYSASSPYRIIRSKKLDHPFVYFGTVRKGISIIPDYLLERDGQYAWILDAKGPSENIDTGKNVEQAYAYAMHRDVRVPLYALCNGHKLVVFHVSQSLPVIDVRLQEIADIWPMVLGILGCRSAWPNGLPPGFRPDMGLALLKAGLTQEEDGKKYWHAFMSVSVVCVAKVEDNMYSVTGLYTPQDSPEFMVTFDFGPELYPRFLEELSPDMDERVRAALTRQPFEFIFPLEDRPTMTIVGEIGDRTYTNKNESYRPFIAEEFVKEPDWNSEVG